MRTLIVPLAVAALLAGNAAAASAAPVTLRQVTTLGNQSTSLAGVVIAHGAGEFGHTADLRRYLGKGWRCEPYNAEIPNQRVITWRAKPMGAREPGELTRGIDLILESLGQAPGCNADMAVTVVTLGRPGDRLATQAGRLSIGQRWSAVPKAVKRLVVGGGFTETGAYKQLGYFEDPCHPTQRLRGPAGVGKVTIGLDTKGRVRTVTASNPIREGIECNP